MTNAIPGWIEIPIERIKTQERSKHTGASDRNHRTLEIRAAQRVGNIAGGVDALRFQRVNLAYITRIGINEWQEQMVRLVTHIRHFNYGVSHRLELHRQIPVLRVGNLSTCGCWRNGKAGDAQALEKDQTVRIGPQNRVERAGGSLQCRIAGQANRLSWVQCTTSSRACGHCTYIDETSEIGIRRSVIAGKSCVRNAIATAQHH